MGEESRLQAAVERGPKGGISLPGTGDIVSIDLFGNQKTVVSGLDFPTGMTFGRGANL